MKSGERKSPPFLDFSVAGKCPSRVMYETDFSISHHVTIRVSGPFLKVKFEFSGEIKKNGPCKTCLCVPLDISLPPTENRLTISIRTTEICFPPISFIQ